MQITSFLCRIFLLSVACLAVPYFSTLSLKRYDFQKKKLLNIKFCFDSVIQVCWQLAVSKLV